MIALLVLLTFAVAILIDHLINRQPITVTDSDARPVPQPRPRLIPSIVAGFRVPDNLRYHPGHTWAVAETPNLVRVGIDDLAAKLTGKAESVKLPQRGQWIRQGQKVIGMLRNGKEVGLVSPIEGTVVDVNDELSRNPALAHEDPYGEGWLIRVNAPDPTTNFRNLLGGSFARRWMDEAAARLRTLTAAPAAAFAQDGGVVLDNVLDQLPAGEIEKIEGEFFLTA
jgi:glycine cleavage system H protein